MHRLQSRLVQWHSDYKITRRVWLYIGAPPSEQAGATRETQSSLTNYTDKFHLLYSLVTEHSSLKQDIELIKEFMEEHKQDTQTREQHHSDEFLNDNDEACSVSTIIPHELERVDEEDEKVAAECEDHCCSTHEVG